MQIVSIIFTCLFLIILISYLLIASKRKTLKNIFCLVTNVITFIMTFLFTKLTITLAGNKVVPFLSDLIKEAIDVNQEEWVNDSSIELITKFISTIIIGLISFFFIFIIFIFLIFSCLICRIFYIS